MNHKDRAHAVLGGSSAYIWSKCSGYGSLMPHIAKEDAGDKAREGTRAHEASEILLEDFLNYKLTGAKGTARFPKLNLPKEMEDHLYAYKDAIWEKTLNESITGKAYGLEDKFILSDKLDMWGSVDFWCVYIDDRGKRVGAIVDLKYGYYFVPAEKNIQLAFYAAAMQEEFSAAGKPLDYVRAAIFQPRSQGEAYRETKFTAKELESYKKKFFKAAKEIFVTRKPKFKVGDWCKFCKAKTVCNAYLENLKSETSLLLSDHVPGSLPDASLIPIETCLKVAGYKNELKDFIDGCYRRALGEATNGKKFPGWKLVETRTRRKWASIESEIIKGIEALGVNPTEPKLRGITEIERELKKTYDNPKELLEPFVERTQSSVSLVKDTDERIGLESTIDLLITEE